MRLWMVSPAIMCDRHLLGDHYECHMFAGCIEKGKSLKGYVAGNLFDAASLNARHDSLAEEMESRGFAHRSPLSKHSGTSTPIDSALSLKDLLGRCAECRKRHERRRTKS